MEICKVEVCNKIIDNMKNSPYIGFSIIVACVIVLASFTNVVGVQTVESSNHILVKDTVTPIEWVFLLIAKLRNHKDIQEFEENIDSVDNVEGEILRIIEGDEELNSIAKQLSGEDCGCEDESLPLEWTFPVICLFLFPLVMLFTVAHLMTGIDLPFYIMMTIGSILNCMWQL